ncbi:hypothetical protein C8Q78DRAFT_651613 [Trametes maxima]|nr:hypothetical protein C8Q78DRAFT_651613 [Trametes maxima]
MLHSCDPSGPRTASRPIFTPAGMADAFSIRRRRIRHGPTRAGRAGEPLHYSYRVAGAAYFSSYLISAALFLPRSHVAHPVRLSLAPVRPPGFDEVCSATTAMLSHESSLFPLAALFALLLFAGLAWCILSSCMGRSILAGLSELWEMILLSARSGGGADRARRRMNPGRWDDDELFELEIRGRPRMG